MKLVIKLIKYFSQLFILNNLIFALTSKKMLIIYIWVASLIIWCDEIYNNITLRNVHKIAIITTKMKKL